MAYRIAVASDDGENINKSFREASEFAIIEVRDDDSYQIAEVRAVSEEDGQCAPTAKQGCGRGSGCGNGTGCGGQASPKFELISDCRAFLSTHVGFKAQKVFEKKLISTFELNGTIDAALKRLIPYFRRVDRHQSLRGFVNEKN